VLDVSVPVEVEKHTRLVGTRTGFDRQERRNSFRRNYFRVYLYRSKVFRQKREDPLPAGLATKLASSVILWIVGPADKSPERIRIEWCPLLAKSTQEVGARSQQARESDAPELKSIHFALLEPTLDWLVGDLLFSTDSSSSADDGGET